MSKILALKRLSVFYMGAAVYDETFHYGLNVIYGDNGSGKSTIADLIFFVLGGDLREWKEHASRCDDVVAEIIIDDAILTIKRTIGPEPFRPMHIYFGNYEEAMEHGIGGWQRFDYARSTGGFSFSQVLFKALGIPESPSEGDKNITMHQLLRALYSDQMTAVQRILRAEPFDSYDTRQAIGDLTRIIHEGGRLM